MKRYAYTPIPNVNWNDLFYDIKFKAFTAGFIELYSHLDETEVNNLGYIKYTSKSIDKQTQWYRTNNDNLLNQFEKNKKIACKQARQLGVSVGGLGNDTWHLRKLV